MFQKIFDTLKNFWDWLITSIQEWFVSVLQSLTDTLTSYYPDISWDFSMLLPYFGWLDKWVPLEYGFGLVAAYWLIYLVFNVIKFVIWVCPFIG